MVKNPPGVVHPILNERPVLIGDRIVQYVDFDEGSRDIAFTVAWVTTDPQGYVLGATDGEEFYSWHAPFRREGEEPCTGISAFWCPRCGDCTCTRHEDGSVDFDEMGDCPLHSHGSTHALQSDEIPASTPHPTTPQRITNEPEPSTETSTRTASEETDRDQ